MKTIVFVSCKYFMKKAMCIHLEGLSNLFNFNTYPGKYNTCEEQSVKFKSKNKRGRKPGSREKFVI